MAVAHPAAPAACWRTVTVWPAITNDPVRSVARLALTVNVTVPLLVPLTPPLSPIQPASLLAVHAHPAVVVTFTATAPPLAGMV